MDDQAVVRKAVESMLRLIGYQVVLAADGEEMIELYRKARQSGDPFDAVILDLTVPGGTGGREAVRKLLQIDPDAKAIASSGYSNDPVLAGFRIYGFSGVISKPYSIEQLGATLRNVLIGDPEKGEA
jgi:CheY-like chemotaxis protein